MFVGLWVPLFCLLSYSRGVRFCLFLYRVRSFYCFFVTLSFCVPRLRGRPLLLEGFIGRAVSGQRPFVVSRLVVEPKCFKFFFRFEYRFCVLDFFFLTSICDRVFYCDRTVYLCESRLYPLFAFVPRSGRHVLGGVLYFNPIRDSSRYRAGRFVLR